MIYGILLFPFAAAAIAFALRHLRFAAATFSAFASLVLAALLVLQANAPAATLFGRTLALSAPVGAHLAFSVALLAIAFISTWPLPENALSWMLAFLALGFLLWAVAIEITSLSVLFLIASTVFMVMCASADSTHPSMWSMRALVTLVTAGFLMLAAAWMVERPVMEGMTTPSQAGPILLFLGYWILLAAFPFSVWQFPAFRVNASIPRVLFGVILPHTLLIQLMIQLQGALAPLGSLVPALLFYSGMATLIMGGVGTAAQTTLGGMLAYLASAEMGAVLMALGSGASSSSALGVTGLVHRGIGLVAMGIGIRTLSLSLGNDGLETMRGAFRRAPVTVTGTLLAGLSLSGFPPLAGFSTRFSLYRMVASEHLPWAVAMVITGLLPAAALARFALRAFQVVPVPRSRRERLWPAVLVLALGSLLLFIGIWPQALSSLFERWRDVLLFLTIPD